MNRLFGYDRGLVTQMLSASGQRRVWPAEYRSAEARYLDNLGILSRDISDGELASVIAQLESQLDHPLPEQEATT